MSTKPTSPSTSGKKVFVGLSGGVDSAVSAALLKEEGYDVTGVFIRAWQPDWLPCTWREERRDAMKVALELEIPFLFLDAEKEYKQGVVDKMLEEYKKNRTPNPDVLCNKEIKFGTFWQFARERGADFIATGHYARIEDGTLKEGKDIEKDQSYFLWTLTQDDLSHTLFPVGHLEKSEVRELAKKFNLPVAEKKDSQGICFMGDVSMEDFLSHYIEAKPGKVVNADGEVIGTHKGLIYYTVGERHGFDVVKKGESSGPFYVVLKDAKKNVLVVSDKEEEIKEFSPKKILISATNWVNVPENPEFAARIRYRGEKLHSTLLLEGKKLCIEFKEPVRGLSLGQSVVFYYRDECLGGAVMDKIIE
ncbi:tRNA 2-thiouridine(34) synthase MnmA [Candidatus Parcubacteria bacterium]|nr:tRNA 2-thiouridine(34) synthase MnmA [Candidatus Parcubacteria bacterium]